MPASKEKTRIKRLEWYLKQLVTYRSTHGDTLKISEITPTPKPLEARKLFENARPVPTHLSALPAVPFLVPAVAEALMHSDYGSITAVVPGEADIYCSARARACGGIILSSDSDLLVGDIGSEGSVSFFRDVTLSDTEGKSTVLTTILFRPRDIAARLGLVDLQGLAFVLTRDSAISFQEANRKAKLREQAVNSHAGYQAFIQCYNGGVSNEAEKLPVDPRVSELVAQYRALTLENSPRRKAGEGQFQPKVYLPFLLDDPSRSSAWAVSTSLRTFSYSLLNLTIDDTLTPTNMIEYGRRGHRIVPVDVNLIDEHDCTTYGKALVERLQKARTDFGDLSNLDFWRTYGIYEVCQWYNENDKPTPTQDGVRRLLGPGDSCPSVLTWEDIHLSAQMQGVLYSIRMLQQIITEVKGGHESEAVGSQVELLHKWLSDLPSLQQLFPPRHHLRDAQRSDKNSDHIIKLMFSLLEKEYAGVDSTKSASLEAGIAGQSEAKLEAPSQDEDFLPQKKRRMERTMNKIPIEVNPADRFNNMYSVLETS